MTLAIKSLSLFELIHDYPYIGDDNQSEECRAYIAIDSFCGWKWKDIYLHKLQFLYFLLCDNDGIVAKVTFLFILNSINELICQP